jgi:hypothetical protein
VADLLNAGAAGLQHPQISEQSVEVGDPALAAEEPRDAATVIFEQHQSNLVHGLCRSSEDVSNAPFNLADRPAKASDFPDRHGETADRV